LDQLEYFLITHYRLVGNKVTNTISYAKVEYHMCKYRCIIAFDVLTEGKMSVAPKSWLSPVAYAETFHGGVSFSGIG